MKKLIFTSAVAIALFFASCSKDTPEELPAPGSDISGINDISVTDHIQLEGHDDMKYDKSLFKVKANKEVKVTLKNVGKLPKEAMGHNVVILKAGTDVNAFALEALKEKANDYIPQSAEMKNAIITHSKLLGPGESDSFTFTAGKPDVYKIICTFPGHHGTMHGQIVVVK